MNENDILNEEPQATHTSSDKVTDPLTTDEAITVNGGHRRRRGHYGRKRGRNNGRGRC